MSSKQLQEIKIIRSLRLCGELVDKLRAEGKTIGFVPTMGALHEGHLSLVDEAKKRADFVIMSIFVNPTQFDKKHDLENYPHDFEADEKLAKSRGVNCIFYPEAEEMYPRKSRTSVAVSEITNTLCGATRKGHFDGVALVVAKLFNIVKPHFAVFGQKDAQQVAVIRQMVSDLNFDVKIITAPIAREKDGLAMSSRNLRLSAENRIRSLALHRGLSEAKKEFENGERNAEKLIHIAQKTMKNEAIQIDYLEIVDWGNFQKIQKIEKTALFAVAAFLDDVRLIDNEILKIIEN